MKKWLVLLTVLAFFISGCGRRERIRLDELEQEAAAALLSPLALHEGLFPEAPITNVAQIFGFRDLERSHRKHPSRLQERFRAFGDQAGFKNSIYEKYVFVPRGVTNLTKGEPVLMSAEPFIDQHGERMRMVIWKAGKQDYRLDRLNDSRLRQLFQEANAVIPRPSPASPPPSLPPLAPDPVSVSVQRYFRDVAGNLGIGRGSWWIILLLYAGGAGLFLLFLLMWFGWQRRH